MRRFYDGMVDQIAAAVGPLDDMSVLDVGCNTGYFPLAFARRGARQTKGIDRIDYSATVALLNDICGTSVQFGNWDYDGELTSLEQHDLVLSIAVLVHLSEPLRHLAWLGSSARKALMVFTPAHAAADYVARVQSGLSAKNTGKIPTPPSDPPDYSIRYHAANRYYVDAKFPHCFDITTLSEPLLRFAFERMGFTRIIEITAARESMPPEWADAHIGLLGIREAPAPVVPQRTIALSEVDLEERDQKLKTYVREQMAPVHDALEQLTPLQDALDKQSERVKSLESTVDERSNRLKSMERTLEERSNRIASLEATIDERDRRLRILEDARRRSIRYRLGSLVKRPNPDR